MRDTTIGDGAGATLPLCSCPLSGTVNPKPLLLFVRECASDDSIHPTFGTTIARSDDSGIANNNGNGNDDALCSRLSWRRFCDDDFDEIHKPIA
jgi:hypothetical protein